MASMAGRPRPQGADSPGSTTALRTANSRRVLDALRAGPPEHDGAGGSTGNDVVRDLLTQADLARATGLAPATVSSIVRELAAAGVVETEAGSGRRGTTVRLAAHGLVVGVDFGHSHVGVALGDVTGTVLATRRVPLAPDHPHRHGLDEAGRLVEETVEAAGRDRGDLRAVGLGVPVPLHHGRVRSSAILPGWTGVDPRALAEDRWGLPVHVENDANLGALAEHRQGAARGYADVVFIKVSTGIGAGVIVGNALFHGSAGTAGEIGHLTLDEQGPVCRCGSRGCLETYVSTNTVGAMLADQLPGVTIDEVVAEARAGSAAARRALEDTGLRLGWGVASVVNLLNPGLVVVGGEMAVAGELLLDSVRVSLRRHALDTAATTPVAAGELGAMASVTGAVLLAAERTELLAG